MDFVVKLPVELDADESLVNNRKKLLEEWGVPGPYVTLWLKEDLGDNLKVQENLKNIFERLVKLIHSIYISSMTDKDTYLALAYNKNDYISKSTSGKAQVDFPKSLFEKYSQNVTNVPFYNPFVMIKALLLLKNIIKDEISKVNQSAEKPGNPTDNYLYLLNQCLSLVMLSLENICKPSLEDASSLNIEIDSSYFDEIIESLSEGEKHIKHPIVLRKLGVGVHPDHGRGLYSTEKIEADTKIIEISLYHALSFYNAIYSEDFGYIARFLTNPTQYINEMKSAIGEISTLSNGSEQNIMYEPIDHDSILLLFTVFQVSKGEKSKWNKIISMWQNPTHACNQNMYMAPKEVRDFLSHGGNDFGSRISNSIDELYDLIKHVYFLLDIVQNEAKRLSDLLGDQKVSESISFFKDLDYKSIFTWKKFNQTKYVLDTRSFSIKWWPLNEEFYKHEKLGNMNGLKVISQSNENNDHLELISIPVTDFSLNGESNNLILPVPIDGVRTILPIADMFNHSHLAQCSSPFLDFENNMISIKNEVEIPKNCEVYIRYGILSSSECLFGYGFIPITKPISGLFDTLTLNLEPEDDDPLYKMKILVLKHSNIPTDHIFSKLSLEKLTNQDLLFKCIDVVTSNDPISTLKNWDKNGGEPNKYSNIDYMQIVYEILESLLKPCIEHHNLLQSYKSSSAELRPFWFQDWGERAISYYSSQIDLIKLSLAKFKKRKS
ncbi:SET domain-containing protein [Cryptosporidium ubiquitum]|uniref:SET domain-containing protein n=1 Tax=Cryptosporidium ubiquitum TaxID=857276 RepID=A0A1J4MGD4_9CRYT|nr:SET domain-containing protein [Cryptosporidium ubiquitum]OII73281.1 SET domain-containing protein [Cryptosporidium ubiquitum]